MSAERSGDRTLPSLRSILQPSPEPNGLPHSHPRFQDADHHPVNGYPHPSYRSHPTTTAAAPSSSAFYTHAPRPDRSPVCRLAPPFSARDTYSPRPHNGSPPAASHPYSYHSSPYHPPTSSTSSTKDHSRGQSDSSSSCTQPAPSASRPHTSPGSSGPGRPSSKVLGKHQVPGEGEFWVLEDGNMLPAVIGGEPVNPAWGITKAGKPRKRLAKACVTCREKKIKCEQSDSGGDKCAQCSRLNKECTIPQDARQSPEPEIKPEVSGPSRPRFDPARLADRGLQDNSVRKTHYGGALRMLARSNSSTDEAENTPTEEASRPPIPQPRPSQILHDHARPFTNDRPGVKRGKHPNRGRDFGGPQPPEYINFSAYDENVDPYLSDRDGTLHLLELYFYHKENGPYSILPRERFLSWVRDSRNKSIDDRMFLFAIMSVGAVFSPVNSFKDQARVPFNIAYSLERQQSDHLTLQLLQARTALATYHLALGDWESFFEGTGNAIRVAQRLRYHDEHNVKNVSANVQAHEYGMSAVQLIECRRRAFWAVYLLDRYKAFEQGSMGAIHDVEVFLRLPCPNSDYHSSTESSSPHFHGDSIREAHTTAPSPAALLVDLASIWGDVTGNAYRAINRSPVIYAEYYEKYFHQTAKRLSDWESVLPERLTYSTKNTAKAIREGYCADYYALWALHCTICMKMGRIGRFALLSEEAKRRNLSIAFYYARRMLVMASALSRAVFNNDSEDIDHVLTQPFPSYAILNACDVVSSGGKAAGLAHLNNRELNDAKAVTGQVARFYAPSKCIYNTIEKRQGLLSAFGIDGGSELDKIRPAHALENACLDKNHDIVYGVPDELFYEVLLGSKADSADPLREVMAAARRES